MTLCHHWLLLHRAAYRYKFFYIDTGTNTDTTFRYRYQFDPYCDIHTTFSSKVRLFYSEIWGTCHQEHHTQPTATACAVKMCSGNCHRACQGSVHIRAGVNSGIGIGIDTNSNSNSRNWNCKGIE